MKRLIMLAVLCAFVLSAAAASAADIKASGAFVTDAIWQKNWDFVDGNSNNSETRTFDVNTRADITFEFIASENVKGVFNIRSQSAWGRDAMSVGAATTDAIQMRKAYLDFNWPGTAINVKAGHQGIALPNAIGGSMLFDTRTGALTVSAPVSENVSVLAGYLRALSSADAGQANHDFYVLAAPMTFGETSVAPFFVMANAGQDAAYPASMVAMNAANATAAAAAAGEIDSAYWLGVSATSAIAGFNVSGDLNYGSVSAENEAGDRAGFYLALAGEMAMDAMTPEVFFVYTSGEDDDNNNGSERLPTIADDWGIGSFFFGGDEWLTGSLQDTDNYLGFWALGLSLKDIASFADGLSHTVHVIYAKGTNDKDWADAWGKYGSTLSEEDSLIEVDFNTYYKLYDELSIGLELGYLNLDADNDVWDGAAQGDGGSAYKIGTGITYKF